MEENSTESLVGDKNRIQGYARKKKNQKKSSNTSFKMGHTDNDLDIFVSNYHELYFRVYT